MHPKGDRKVFRTARPRRQAGVGRIRRKLTERLRALNPAWVFLEPDHLKRNNPIYQSAMFDACSWDADFRDINGRFVHIYSWDSMQELVRAKTISFSPDVDDPHTFELVCD